MRIVVNPDELKWLGRSIRGNLSFLEVGMSSLHSAVCRLDWELRARYPVEVEWRGARRKMELALQQGFRLSSLVESKAALFERADRAGYPGVQDFRQAMRKNYFISKQAIDAILRLLGTKFLKDGDKYERMFRPCPFPFPLVVGGPLSLGIQGLYWSLVKDKETRKAVASLCFQALEVVAPGAGGLGVVKFLYMSFLDYLESEETSERALRVAIAKNVIELVISSNPYGRAILVINAAVQLGGNVMIRGIEAWGKAFCVEPFHDLLIEQSSDRAHRALAKLNVGNITRDLGAIADDIFVEPSNATWSKALRQPTAGNVAGAFFTTLSSLGNPAMAITNAVSNPHTRSMLFQDVKSLGSHLEDFAVGTFEAPVQLARHGVVTGLAMASESVGEALPPGVRQSFKNCSDNLLRSINSGWEFPAMEQAFQY